MGFLAKLKLNEPWAAILVAILGFTSASITYYLTEKAKLSADSYERRAAQYEKLLASASSFQDYAYDPTSRRIFLREFDLCWLYCSDEVLRKGYAFLETIKTGAATSQESKSMAFAEFVATVRHDLILGTRVESTTMRPNEYRLYRANL